MKIKPNLESLIYVVVIVLCLVTLALVAISSTQFGDTKNVYQGF
jgi:hypothetical protein